jgi:uncharacterized protein (DUF433 family)
MKNHAHLPWCKRKRVDDLSAWKWFRQAQLIAFGLGVPYWYNKLSERWERTMPEKFLERIEINPAVMLGKPVIKGTRVPIELLLRKLSEGATEADLLDAYPRLTKIDIQAALAYAASVLSHETIILQVAA